MAGLEPSFLMFCPKNILSEAVPGFDKETAVTG
jgi:hypothetical protein